MLRAVNSAGALALRSLAAGPARAIATGSGRRGRYEDEHVLISEQEQVQWVWDGHLLEKLDDPEEVGRMLTHLKSKSTFGDTMADTILRETLEARKADFEARMSARDDKVLCQHGHAHDVCCGASQGEVEATE